MDRRTFLNMLAGTLLVAPLPAAAQQTMAEGRGFVSAGCLVSYAPNYSAMGRDMATLVDKIFKGAKPGELPIVQPTKFEVVINLKTAKALGMTVPQSLLLRADEVIQ